MGNLVSDAVDSHSSLTKQLFVNSESGPGLLLELLESADEWTQAAVT